MQAHLLFPIRSRSDELHVIVTRTLSVFVADCQILRDRCNILEENLEVSLDGSEPKAMPSRSPLTAEPHATESVDDFGACRGGCCAAVKAANTTPTIGKETRIRSWYRTAAISGAALFVGTGVRSERQNHGGAFDLLCWPGFITASSRLDDRTNWHPALALLDSSVRFQFNRDRPDTRPKQHGTRRRLVRVFENSC